MELVIAYKAQFYIKTLPEGGKPQGTQFFSDKKKIITIST